MLKKREEIKRLKALKLKELRAKLERIGVEAGRTLDGSKAMSAHLLPRRTACLTPMDR